eukprot:gene11219-14259_t
MHTYLNELAVKLQQSYSSVKSSVRLRVEAGNIKLDIDTAIPIGLIVNELVINAYKYAFAENESGEIFIRLEQTSNELLTLKVNDNGQGTPVSPDTVLSFGTQIVTSLCRQLKADWQIDNNEDEALIADHIALCLQDLGYTVAGICDCGPDAFECLHRACPSLVLLDINLNGGVDGVDIAHIINE